MGPRGLFTLRIELVDTQARLTAAYYAVTVGRRTESSRWRPAAATAR